MEIRAATGKDCSSLAAIQVHSYRTAYAGVLPPSHLARFTCEEQAQDWREWLASRGDDVLLIAETTTGTALGYALGRPAPGEIAPYDAELLALHVRQSHQGLGIGSQLIAAIATQLEQRGCISLMLWVLETNPARALYEKLGGQVIGEKAWGGNGAFGTSIREVAYGWPDIRELVPLPGPPTAQSQLRLSQGASSSA